MVASLLLNLGSPVKEVRRAAVHCLQALSGAASPFHMVIEHVVPKAEEVTSDATYVVQVTASTERCRCAHPCTHLCSFCLSQLLLCRDCGRVQPLDSETDRVTSAHLCPQL